MAELTLAYILTTSSTLKYYHTVSVMCDTLILYSWFQMFSVFKSLSNMSSYLPSNMTVWIVCTELWQM